VAVTALFTDMPQLVVSKEIGGSKIFWPDMGIITLSEFVAGNAYLVLMANPVSVTFPDCE